MAILYRNYKAVNSPKRTDNEPLMQPMRSDSKEAMTVTTGLAGVEETEQVTCPVCGQVNPINTWCNCPPAQDHREELEREALRRLEREHHLTADTP